MYTVHNKKAKLLFVDKEEDEDFAFILVAYTGPSKRAFVRLSK